VGDKCATAPTEAQLRSQGPAARGERAASQRASSRAEERRLAEASADEPVRRHFRHLRPYQNGYVVGVPVGFGPVVIANPAFTYGGYSYGGYRHTSYPFDGYPYGGYSYGGYDSHLGYGGSLERPIYLFAPNAKIIRLDRED
jgi:hypothetical protein